MYATEMFAKHADADSESDDNSQAHDRMKVAGVNEDQSFTDAFNQARAEVGPGGVFHWHGGIYSTYTSDEWAAMTDDQKDLYAASVKPEVRPSEMPGYAEPVAAEVHSAASQDEPQQPEVAETHTESHQATGYEMASADDHTNDNDVRVVGQGEVEGHQAAALDLDGDGEADVAVIDVDDSGSLTRPDVIVDREGNLATMGEVADAEDGSMMASTGDDTYGTAENPGTYMGQDESTGMEEDMSGSDTGYVDL